MRLFKHASIPVVALCLAPLCATAQGTSGNVQVVDVGTPKPGMTQQFEQGIKQVIAWEKRSGCAIAVGTFQIITGDRTGSYDFLEAPAHWADLDHPPACQAEFERQAQKLIGPYGASLVTEILELLPNLSHLGPAGAAPEKYYQVVELHVRQTGPFLAALARISAAENKANPSSNPLLIYELRAGGSAGDFTIAIGHPNWADFGETHGQPMAQVLTEAYGANEADLLRDTLSGVVESEEEQIVQYRPDLSYATGGSAQ